MPFQGFSLLELRAPEKKPKKIQSFLFKKSCKGKRRKMFEKGQCWNEKQDQGMLAVLLCPTVLCEDKVEHILGKGALHRQTGKIFLCGTAL